MKKIVFFLMFMVLSSLVLASDTDLFVPMVADEELYIGFVGDSELGVFPVGEVPVHPGKGDFGVVIEREPVDFRERVDLISEGVKSSNIFLRVKSLNTGFLISLIVVKILLVCGLVFFWKRRKDDE